MTNITKDAQLTQMSKLNFHENGLTRIVDNVQAGDIKATTALEYFRKLQIIAKECEDRIIGLAEDELSYYSDAELRKGVIIGDAVMTIRSTAGRYKYSDPLISALRLRIKALETLAKEATKVAEHGGEVLNPETGEVITPAEYQNGQQKVFISFKRKE